MRLSLVGPAGRLDLATPHAIAVEELARRYADHFGLTPPVLATAAGRILRPDQGVLEAGLDDGDVLIVVSPDASSGIAGSGVPLPVLGGSTQWVPLALAAVAAVAAGVVAGTGSAVARPGAGSTIFGVCAAVLLVGAVMGAVPFGPSPAGDARIRSVIGPLLGASAGFVLGVRPGPAGLLLGVGVAALVGLVFAAISRAFLPDDEDDLADVVLAVTAVAAVVSLGLLLLGSSPVALMAVLYAVAVIAARLLPYLVVDVPDEALLDLDRLAVTAWSAREQPRTSRRRRVLVRPDTVMAVVRRGQRQVSTATVVLAVVVSTTGPLLVLATDESDLRAIGTLGMVGLGGAAFALMARSLRSRSARLALRLAALWVLAFLGAELVHRGGSQAVLPWVIGTAVSGVIVAVSGVSLGRGWRSIWWARAADVAEALSIVLVLASVTLSTGLFDAVRGFAS
ncbi:MAG: hypothetical protein ABIN79_06935 [Marmoricola sp.]